MIRNRDLPQWMGGEMVERLSGVIHAWRIKVRRVKTIFTPTLSSSLLTTRSNQAKLLRGTSPSRSDSTCHSQCAAMSAKGMAENGSTFQRVSETLAVEIYKTRYSNPEHTCLCHQVLPENEKAAPPTNSSSNVFFGAFKRRKAFPTRGGDVPGVSASSTALLPLHPLGPRDKGGED
ncbi:hypothetical protein PoB_006561500 [Plakobranchus ocellatus]|uniref:Uncharacterized protein n=1 Tax=Plakobranchus ocellatus TaxID=259542 RepID=A0AAV4D4V0_9GAST|nr:hypothetical protein PoB_006561500 [Plakobranchus ocellatus]